VAGSPTGRPDDADLLRAAPALARLAAGAWWRTAEWTLFTSMRVGSRLVQAALSGESAAQLLDEAGVDVRDYVRRLLGVLDSEVREGGFGPSPPQTAASPGTTGDRAAGVASLRKRGEELLRRSADVELEEEAHPAYERILTELAPDEGRILRLLALEGPAPAVDVRAAKPLRVGSELIAPGLSMIGAQAGCRHVERVPAYLNNLYRLGLIWFSREPLEDPSRYQVVEAQPEVVEAMREAGRAKTVRRSIHLTPFGEDFCEVCLPLHTAELEALPGAGPRAGGPASHDSGPASPDEEPAGGG